MKKTTESLQGTWQYATLKVDGKAIPKRSLSESTITIEGNKFQVASTEESYQGTFTIDDDATPPTIDIQFKDGPEQGRALGIFELDKDSLTICLGSVGHPRPIAFASKAGSGHALETLRRAPAGARARTTAGRDAGARPAGKARAGKEVPAPDFPKGDTAELAELEGTWAMVSAQRDGQAMPQSYVAGARRVARGDETTVLINGAVFMSARMAVDPTRKPKTIDYLLTSGASRNKTQLGIYELAGDRLKLCFAKPTQDRPDDFTAAAGSGRTLSVWKRTKE